MKRGASVRTVTVVACVVFLAACTKTTRVPINPDDAIRQYRHIEGIVAFHLADARTIVSDDVSVGGDDFVVASMREDDGKMRDIPPLVIEREQVESMELLSKEYQPVVIAAGTLLLVFMLFYAFSDKPGFGDV